MFLDFLHPGIIDVRPSIPAALAQWDNVYLEHCPVPRVDDAADALVTLLLLTVCGSVLTDNATDFFDDF
jgi:hypothetical protein